MMSLLLCFFVLLFAMGKTEQAKFQALSESFNKQFGFSHSKRAKVRGNRPALNSRNPRLGSDQTSVVDKQDNGKGKPNKRANGHFVTNIARSGDLASRGTVIVFPEMSSELSDKHRETLELVCRTQLGGLPNRIEIRGHASGRPPGADDDFADDWELAFQRCRQVMEFVVKQPGIDSRRIRLGVSGRNEPRRALGTNDLLTENSHVEVFLLNETAAPPGTEIDESAIVPGDEPADQPPASE